MFFVVINYTALCNNFIGMKAYCMYMHVLVKWQVLSFGGNSLQPSKKKIQNNNSLKEVSVYLQMWKAY